MEGFISKYELLPDSEVNQGYKRLEPKSQFPKYIMVNAPHFQSSFFPEEEFKGLFTYAKGVGADGIIVIGDIYNIDLKRFSVLKIYRTLFQEKNVPKEVIRDKLPPYLINKALEKEREAAEREGREPVTDLDGLSVIGDRFVTTKTKLNYILDELIELFDQHNDSGIPVYVVPGMIETKSWAKLVRDEIHRTVIEERNELKSEIKALRYNIKGLEKDNHDYTKLIESLRIDKDGLESRIGDEGFNDETIFVEHLGEEITKLDYYERIDGEIDSFIQRIEDNKALIDDCESKIKGLALLRKNITMTNFDDEETKRLYDKYRKFIIKKLERHESLIVTDTVARLSIPINGDEAAMLVRYNASQLSENPLKRAHLIFKEYVLNEELLNPESPHARPRCCFSGGLHGHYREQILRDNSPSPHDRLGDFVVLSDLLTNGRLVGNERYVKTAIIQPFIKYDKESIDKDPKLANDPILKMFKKLNCAPGATVLNFIDESMIYSEILDLKFLHKISQSSSSELESLIHAPLFLKWTQSDKHYGSQHIKKIVFSDKLKSLISKNFDLGFHYIDANLAYNLVKSRIPYVVCDSDQGELIQAMNYATYLEKHPFRLSVSKMKRIASLDRAGMSDKIADFYPEKLSDFLKSNPLPIDELLLLNNELSNIIRSDEQMIEWIRREVKSLKPFIKRMYEFGQGIGYYGPIKVNINGGHEQHTTNGTGITISTLLTEHEKSIIESLLSINFDDPVNNGLIIDGAIGQGTSFAEYSCGISGEGNKDYRLQEYHKSHSSLRDQISSMINISNKQQLLIDGVISGHTHLPCATVNHLFFVQNGSTQGENEYSKSIKRLPPSHTCCYTIGLPVKGRDSGELVLIPFTMEFVNKALINPKLIDNLINSLNIFGRE